MVCENAAVSFCSVSRFISDNLLLLRYKFMSARHGIVKLVEGMKLSGGGFEIMEATVNGA